MIKIKKRDDRYDGRESEIDRESERNRYCVRSRESDGRYGFRDGEDNDRYGDRDRGRWW